MSTTMNKTASVLAFIIGALSIIAGAQVIAGWDPGYYVLNWLPVYNFMMGVATVLLPAILIWRNSRYAAPAAIGVLGIHAGVLLLLLTALRGTPAAESVMAMVFRVAVWLIILALMFVRLRKKQTGG
jgi:hypothetical protein